MATIPEALSLALQHHRAGRLREADALYRQILAEQPNHPEVLHYLGVIAFQDGRHGAAIEFLDRAIKAKPGAASFHNAIGEVCRAQVRLEEAEVHYRQALTLKPDFAGAHNNLGSALWAQGKSEEAVVHYRRALALNPAYAEAHSNLGSALWIQGKKEEAAAHFQAALTLKPNSAEVHNNLGNVLKDQGRLEEAVAHYRRALALKPAYAEAHNNLGIALNEQDKLEEAATHYRQALALEPTAADTHINLGNVLKGLGKIEEAEACFRRALAIRPSDGLRIKLATMLPVILPSLESVDMIRKRFEENIDALLKEELTIKDPLKEVGQTNFYLAYQGYNDRELQKKIARLYERACPSLLYVAPHCATPARPEKTGRVRIGFISRFLFHHSVTLTARGLMTELSKEKFEKYVFFVQPVKEDHVSALLRQAVDRTVVLPGDLAAARARIAEERLDILVYLDIGMEPFTYFLAFARLAPVQCVFPGHPVTTGISAVDYFFSGEALELVDAEAHYSERLVRLKHRTSYYYRPGIPASTKSRKEFGLDEERTIYLCPQTLFKVHPEFDGIMAEIIRADPNGEVVLVEGKEPHWTQLLKDRLERSIPDVTARVRFLPRMNGDDFLRLLMISDVVLDTIHFGGGTTSSMALSMGSPVVTLPGDFFRSRVTYARYRQMGLMECVAKSPAQYVEIALRLGTDAEYRRKISAKILSMSHVLFEDMEIVREYERFFLKAIRDVRKQDANAKRNAAQ